MLYLLTCMVDFHLDPMEYVCPIFSSQLAFMIRTAAKARSGLNSHRSCPSIALRAVLPLPPMATSMRPMDLESQMDLRGISFSDLQDMLVVSEIPTGQPTTGTGWC